jgi:hypothetical protein
MNMMTNWSALSFVELEDVFGDDLWQRLENEGRGLAKGATLETYDSVISRRDGSFNSPSRYWSAAPGAELARAARSRDLMGLLRDASGLRRLVPSRAGYAVYRRGDFMGLHRDAVKCTVVVTFALTPNLGPMGWGFELRDNGNEDLEDLVRTKGPCPEGFPAMEIPYRRLNGFDGYNVPHWRSPFDDEIGILGSICYFDL